MGTNIRLYKEVDKKYTGCNLKTMELLGNKGYERKLGQIR